MGFFFFLRGRNFTSGGAVVWDTTETNRDVRHVCFAHDCSAKGRDLFCFIFYFKCCRRFSVLRNLREFKRNYMNIYKHRWLFIETVYCFLSEFTWFSPQLSESWKNRSSCEDSSWTQRLVLSRLLLLLFLFFFFSHLFTSSSSSVCCLSSCQMSAARKLLTLWHTWKPECVKAFHNFFISPKKKEEKKPRNLAAQ